MKIWDARYFKQMVCQIHIKCIPVEDAIACVELTQAPGQQAPLHCTGLAKGSRQRCAQGARMERSAEGHYTDRSYAMSSMNQRGWQ
ncbi:hypothetical protein F506_09535 [Herbaspirillum hiltneri N3]|uniref:Uncharacterized protein n=1 Tax=Herbaspirillum hiltneri N3 TaxID=1262470 RepID=A0ABM5V0F2_9BURK|nr:hypothetical protein F506_09535 [Herbaspirillum hiltneri N3]